MTELAVHHFGPDVSTVGGMATVIGILTEHDVGGDAVEAHPTWRPSSPFATAGAWLRSVLALLRLPVDEIAHVHLSERGSFLREGPLVMLAHKRGLVTVATIHGASFVPFARRRPAIVSAVLRCADVITCLDEETLDRVGHLAPSARSALVPNPVVVEDRFLPADATDELVVFAGEIGLRKGADVLCRAWELVARQRPDARCLLVGPAGDYDPPGMERLTVMQPVGRKEMIEILTSARVIALPSRAEGMPMVLAEAMSVGRPVVSTPVGGIAELAAAGGFVVPVEDEAALAARLLELLRDPALARSIGERGRNFCLQTRGVEIVDARYRELYSNTAA